MDEKDLAPEPSLLGVVYCSPEMGESAVAS